MNSKERVRATIERRPADRTPLDCWLYQKQFLEQLAASYGSREKFLDEFGIDIFVGFVPWPNQMGRRVSIDELASAQLGDPRDPFWLNYSAWTPDFAGVNVRQALDQHGDRRWIIAHCWGLVEGTSSFLGIEDCWYNLGAEPERMQAHFDRYADWLCGLVDSLVAAGVDMLTLSDDWGSNQTMLFSPPMWRRLIKPYAGRVVQHARARGLPVNLHSDGHILAIMDDVIEMGYASLHPVQESAGMDPRQIKAQYGDRLTLYGSLDVIDGLMQYDGPELDDYITRRFEIYAPGGGFIFNAGHFIQPDIPVQRLIRAYRLANVLANSYGTL
jgi:uroporphyrinogen decarboxylase